MWGFEVVSSPDTIFSAFSVGVFYPAISPRSLCKWDLVTHRRWKRWSREEGQKVQGSIQAGVFLFPLLLLLLLLLLPHWFHCVGIARGIVGNTGLGSVILLLWDGRRDVCVI